MKKKFFYIQIKNGKWNDNGDKCQELDGNDCTTMYL